MKLVSKKVRIAILGEFDTQGDFAAALGTHESRVSQILNGRRKLSASEAKRWQGYLRCDPKILEPVTRME